MKIKFSWIRNSFILKTKYLWIMVVELKVDQLIIYFPFIYKKSMFGEKSCFMLISGNVKLKWPPKDKSQIGTMSTQDFITFWHPFYQLQQVSLVNSKIPTGPLPGPVLLGIGTTLLNFRSSGKMLRLKKKIYKIYLT